MSLKTEQQQVTPIKIIRDLFQNKEATTVGAKIITTFSQVVLTEDQRKQLLSPNGYTQLNKFVICQTDKHTNSGSTYTVVLISFLQKDNHIYGYYYDLIGVPHYIVCNLEESRVPLSIPSNAKIIAQQNLVVYHNININGVNMTIILGLSTNNGSVASFHYCNNGKYFTSSLSNTGEQISPTHEVTVVSKNLRQF
jgi:hypothetical protein